MVRNGTRINAERCRIWETALALPGQPNLQTSLVAELAEYLAQPIKQVETRCRVATAELAQTWQKTAPATPQAISTFYRQTDLYLYDLTWWHALGANDSALIQVEALETALAHRARRALDFGSGIGSLGVLLAQNGLDVTLAEVNPHLNTYARRRFEQRGLTADFLDLNTDPLPVDTFDFIAAVDVFEHLPNARDTLAALANALRPGGVLFIHLPPDTDAGHPMHLWHNPATLLNCLPRMKLWLERANGPTLILRRGEGPRYALNTGLELLPHKQGGLLLSTRPLLALRLNPQAFNLLAQLNGGQTAIEAMTGTAALSLADATAFLDDCARRRLLVKQPPQPAVWPSVSIIIPARNRPNQTRACLESLLALDYPADRVEIIVIDDASTPPLGPILADLPVRVIRPASNIGQSAARNLGAAEAQGELLAFIDNDCLAKPDWLRLLVSHFDDPVVDVVGGRAISPPVEGLVDAFEAVRSPLDMGVNGGEVGPDQVVAYLPTCNLVVRRETLLRLGGFQTEMLLGEDVDFIWRALRVGGGARYVPEGEVVHRHRVRLGALLRRRMEYASSEADLQRRHPAGRRTMFLPPTVLVFLIAIVAWSLWWPGGAVLIALAVVGVVIEFGQKLRHMRQVGLSLPVSQILGAILREHGAGLYHLSANITRYYGVPLLIAGLLWLPLLPATIILLLTPSVVDHCRLKPQVSLPVFTCLYWLEMAAYQIGVWSGCLKWRTLRPLLPMLKLRWW